MTDMELASLILRLSIGFVTTAFGLYQMFQPEPWLKYIPKLVTFIMPLSNSSIMRIHATGNLSIGLLLIGGIGLPLSAWLALAWWTFMLPLCGRLDLSAALRDFAIIMAIVAMIVLL